jgi:hypothetical protein
MRETESIFLAREEGSLRIKDLQLDWYTYNPEEADKSGC